jgi:tryptophan 2,3-dioxygenase
MTKPAVWESDPECGHDVAFAYQTHYCSYIRVPYLLQLRSTGEHDPNELLPLTAHQWYELWFKVLLTDLRAALDDAGETYESIKLLRRGIELFKLFDLHADLTETVIVRELESKKCLGDPDVLNVSAQFSQVLEIARGLGRLRRSVNAGLEEAIREYLPRFEAFRTRYRKFLKATLIAYDERLPSYAEWLRLPELLKLQQGVKATWTEEDVAPTQFWQPELISADETMFIITHQCSEIWFQVILDHIDHAIPAIWSGDIAKGTRLMRRVVLIQRLLMSQIRFPATMLPLDFMRFRHQRMERDGKVVATGLSPASGTESYQFREIEIVSGLRDDPVFRKYLAGTDKLPIRLLTPRQAERLEQPTLPEAFHRAVEQRGLKRLDGLFTPAHVKNPNIDLAELADTLIEFDEFFRLWRLNHVLMVEKMIGARSGTGFLGPEYLMETAGIKLQQENRVFEERQVRPRFFEELWAVRTRLGAY